MQSCTSLLELFHDQTKPPEPFVLAVVTPSESTTTPEYKPSLNDVFDAYIRMESRLHRVYQEQQHLEERLFGQSLTESKSVESITHLANRAINALIRKAEQQFAPPGGSLKLDIYEALRATNQYEWDEQYRQSLYGRNRVEEPKLNLDLDALWAHLEATYGGDGGLIEGYRQQAKVLIERFRLANQENIRKTASAVIIDLRVWSEKKDYGPNRGKLEVHYNSGESRTQVFHALRCFAKWAELSDLSNRLNPNFHDITDYGFTFASREKRTFPGLEIVFFKEKWEWRFSQDVAEKLMLFLGEFGT